MLRFIDLNYHYHAGFSHPAEVMHEHRLSTGYARHLRDKMEVIMVKHLNHTGNEVIEGIPCHFFKRTNRFWQIPFPTHRFIKSVNPDIIAVQGFIFPLQVLALRRAVGKHCRIIIQHHGEQPYRGIKKWIQRIACRRADAFVFTATGNAEEWISKNIIAPRATCTEILEAAPVMQPQPKTLSRTATGVQGSPAFLWVGRLLPGKDPLTVLRAFASYYTINTEARLYMIYQEADLLPQIQSFLSENPALQQAILLAGKVAPGDMPYWYSAADYFISGSHKEGSGYALLEAMTCGCIPVVTTIPSFTKITDHGRYGILWETGNSEDLARQLSQLNKIDRESYAQRILDYAAKELSAGSIAKKWMELCSLLQQQF